MSTPSVRQVGTQNIQPECPWPPKGISWTINKLNVSLKDMRPLLVLSMTYHGCQHETAIELEIQLTLLFGLFIAGKCIKHKGYGTFRTDLNYAVRRKGGHAHRWVMNSIASSTPSTSIRGRIGPKFSLWCVSGKDRVLVTRVGHLLLH